MEDKATQKLLGDKATQELRDIFKELFMTDLNKSIKDTQDCCKSLERMPRDVKDELEDIIRNIDDKINDDILPEIKTSINEDMEHIVGLIINSLTQKYEDTKKLISSIDVQQSKTRETAKVELLKKIEEWAIYLEKSVLKQFLELQLLQKNNKESSFEILENIKSLNTHTKNGSEAIAKIYKESVDHTEQNKNIQAAITELSEIMAQLESQDLKSEIIEFINLNTSILTDKLTKISDEGQKLLSVNSNNIEQISNRILEIINSLTQNYENTRKLIGSVFVQQSKTLETAKVELLKEIEVRAIYLEKSVLKQLLELQSLQKNNKESSFEILENIKSLNTHTQKESEALAKIYKESVNHTEQNKNMQAAIVQLSEITTQNDASIKEALNAISTTQAQFNEALRIEFTKKLEALQSLALKSNIELIKDLKTLLTSQADTLKYDIYKQLKPIVFDVINEVFMEKEKNLEVTTKQYRIFFIFIAVAIIINIALSVFALVG